MRCKSGAIGRYSHRCVSTQSKTYYQAFQHHHVWLVPPNAFKGLVPFEELGNFRYCGQCRNRFKCCEKQHKKSLDQMGQRFHRSTQAMNGKAFFNIVEPVSVFILFGKVWVTCQQSKYELWKVQV